MSSRTNAGGGTPADWQDVRFEGDQTPTPVVGRTKKKSVSSETFESGWYKVNAASHKFTVDITPFPPPVVASLQPHHAAERLDEVTLAMADALKVVAISLGVWEERFDASKEQIRALAKGIIDEIRLSNTEKEDLRVAVAKQEKTKEQLAVIAFLSIIFAAVTLLLSESLD